MSSVKRVELDLCRGILLGLISFVGFCLVVGPLIYGLVSFLDFLTLETRVIDYKNMLSRKVDEQCRYHDSVRIFGEVLPPKIPPERLAERIREIFHINNSHVNEETLWGRRLYQRLQECTDSSLKSPWNELTNHIVSYSVKDGMVFYNYGEFVETISQTWCNGQCQCMKVVFSGLPLEDNFP